MKNVRDTGSEVLTVVTVKNTDFWVIKPCTLERSQCFRGTYQLQLQG
jgi:hypothetical protein